ncbi:MAG: LamG domain-containing protein [Pirellulales bacterium]|nr:LamG domain-containing protein [Pirellulales bacterium]
MGGDPAPWDANTTDNWSAGGGDNRYFNLDNVTFNDTASQFNVDLTETLAPGSLTISNTGSNDYTFSGTGAVVGATGITKTGDATATLANTGVNSYAGGIDVQDGTLILASLNNQTAGDINVASGATLQIGNGTDNVGGRFTNDVNSNLTVNGILIGNLGGTANEGIPQNITGSGAVQVNSGGLELSGDNSAFTGTFTASGGTIFVQSLNALGDISAATPVVTASSGGAIDLAMPDSGSGVINLNKNFSLGGSGEGTIFSGALENNTDNVTFNHNGAISLTADTTLRTDGQGTQVNYNTSITGTNTSLTFSMGNGDGGGTTINGGSITNVNAGLNLGTGGLIVNGTGAAAGGTNPGLLNLNAANTYSGDTSIGVGGNGVATVVLNNVDALGTTSNINLGENGNLDVSNLGGLTLTSGQTVAGEGTVTGNLTAPSGTTIRVGAAGVPSTSILLSRHDFEVGGEDSSGNGNEVTFGTSASVDTVATAAVGTGSLALTDAADNNGNRAEGDNYAGVIGGGARTYSFWFNGTNPPVDTQPAFISAGLNSTGERFEIKVQQDGQLRVEIQGNGVNYINTNSTSFFDGNWHHIAVTLPQNGLLDDVILYLDGVAEIDDGSATGEVVNTANANIYYGDSHNGGANRNFEGSMDDVQIYRAELNASEVLALFNSPGSINAGVAPDTSGIGTLTMDGDLTLQAGATLELDLFSETLSDSLDVTGTLALGGTLDIDYFGTTTLANGDTFDIFDFTSASGSFATLDLPTLGAGLAWDTSSLITTGEISVVAALPGDFDFDGDVDGSDFLVWQRTDGTPAGLAAWQANYGSGTLATVGTTSVPEPSSILLVLLVIGFCAGHSRNKGYK